MIRQVHSPILQSSLPDSSFNMEEWDGAAEIFSSASPEQMAEWREKDPCYMGYYQNVILADERRFLVSEALQHVKRVDPDTVTGKRVIIIQDGKALVDVGDDVMKVWNDWTTKSL